jgi:hypothetical protein
MALMVMFHLIAGVIVEYIVVCGHLSLKQGKSCDREENISAKV